MVWVIMSALLYLTMDPFADASKGRSWTTSKDSKPKSSPGPTLESSSFFIDRLQKSGKGESPRICMEDCGQLEYHSPGTTYLSYLRQSSPVSLGKLTGKIQGFSWLIVPTAGIIRTPDFLIWVLGIWLGSSLLAQWALINWGFPQPTNKVLLRVLALPSGYFLGCFCCCKSKLHSCTRDCMVCTF